MLEARSAKSVALRRLREYPHNTIAMPPTRSAQAWPAGSTCAWFAMRRWSWC